MVIRVYAWNSLNRGIEVNSIYSYRHLSLKRICFLLYHIYKFVINAHDEGHKNVMVW